MFFTVDFTRIETRDGQVVIPVSFYEKQELGKKFPALRLVDTTIVNASGIIIESGMFQGCPLHILYYYHMVIMEGLAECCDSEELEVSLIEISDEDKLLFPVLKPYKQVMYWEDLQGFAHSSLQTASECNESIPLRDMLDANGAE
jgi:hypothetical protein